MEVAARRARSCSNYNAVYNLHAASENPIRLARSRFSLLRPFEYLIAIAVIASAAFAPGASASDFLRSGGPYVPTPQEVVDKMLEVAAVTAEDFVMDLGSGDGRIVLTAAARYHARGRGIEIDPDLVDWSTSEARRRGLEKLAQFRSEDALKTRIDEASVLTLYLLPELMNGLRDRIYKELKPGARVVSHDFRFNDWIPDRSVTMEIDEKYGSAGTWQSTIYLWIVPAKIAGRWSATTHEPDARRYVFSFSQTFQHIAGEAHAGAARIPIKDAHIDGSRIRFALPGVTKGEVRRFSGAIANDQITGVIESPEGSVPWSATRLDPAVSMRHSR